ncbi:ROK family transcriptional regulator [Actinoplanes sp. NBRC 103695]|uniref:ROK family transcriptional regulator n=1 Tax=Actinoplanes sp. NBRC 103695 TaxID=3032202 RepID=UPI0024A1DCBF|nr:ROK family transcriptional regulator [Actinoplanes sp. NBRC 103695]GLY93172.1 transcriptional regulator [Actinoplanes sp. NBRC 103695]
MSRQAGSSKLLRAMNESAALAHLIDPGMLTRADLRRLTALSTPTISEVLRRLTEAGLVGVVAHQPRRRPGPNAEIYAANPDAAYAAAISVRDVGAGDGPSVAAAACDLSGEIKARFEYEADFRDTDPGDVLAEVVSRLGRVDHVQLGISGSYDGRTETIRHTEVPGFGRPKLVPDLIERLGTTVGVDNDVNLAAIAERRHGVARDADGFALLWLGDEGLGLAIDIGGTLLRGARGGAGEIGYMPMSTLDGQDLQDVVGGPAVLALGHEHGISGRTPQEVVSNAEPGAFFTELADRVAVGLAAVIAVLDPSLVVLAGQVGRAGGHVLRDAVGQAMLRAAPLQSAIEVTSIDDDAVLLGALDAGLRTVRESLISSIRDS